jgi:hypothetical protein
MNDHELLARLLSTVGLAGVEPEAARAGRGPGTLLGSQGSGN